MTDIHPLHPQLGPMESGVVKLLEDTLQQARTGAFHTMAIVAVGRNGFGNAFSGPDVGALNLGLDGAKAQLLGAVSQQAASKIIKPR